jgi:hypothetical protein
MANGSYDWWDINLGDCLRYWRALNIAVLGASAVVVYALGRRGRTKPRRTGANTDPIGVVNDLCDDVCQESHESDYERHQDGEGHDDCERSAPPRDSVGTASKRPETLDLALERPLVVLELREADTIIGIQP